MILWMTWHVWMQWRERKRSVALRMSVWVWLCSTSLTRLCRLALLYRMWPSRPGVGFSFLYCSEEDLKAVLKRKFNKRHKTLTNITIYKTADSLNSTFFTLSTHNVSKVFFSHPLMFTTVPWGLLSECPHCICIEIERFPAVTHRLQVCYQIQFLNCPVLQICCKPRM